MLTAENKWLCSTWGLATSLALCPLCFLNDIFICAMLLLILSSFPVLMLLITANVLVDVAEGPAPAELLLGHVG